MMPKLSGIKKNNLKNKFICESDDCNDFLIESDNKKPKMNLKRDVDEIDAVLLNCKVAGDVPLSSKQNGEEDLFGQCQYKIENKKRKLDSFATDGINNGQKKLKDCMEKQAEVRRKCTDRLMRSFSAILTQLESDGAALADNEQRLQRLMAAQLKTAQQAMTVHAQRLQALRDIQGSYLKRVEGLLTRGAMRAEDRPLWFDIYRAFPPAMEPKFARPKPTQPIKQIFYPEDKIRAKFHAANHGLGAVNMLSVRGETHTSRLIKQYQTLQESGVPEDRLIEESVATLTDGEPTVMPKKPREEVAQPKSKNSINVKNIFNEQ